MSHVKSDTMTLSPEISQTITPVYAALRYPVIIQRARARYAKFFGDFPVFLAETVPSLRTKGACRVIMKEPCRARHADVGYAPGWRRTTFAEPPPRPSGRTRTSSDAPPSHRS